MRALFFATLALLVAPAALSERAGQSAGPTDHALERAPVEHQAHPAPYGARTWLADGPTPRVTPAPFAATRADVAPVQLPASGVATRLGTAVGAADATRRLPLSRAPPELS